MKLSYRIRLKARGRKKMPFWYIVATDNKRSSNGLHYKKLGYFSSRPIHNRNFLTLALDFEAFRYWVGKNAEIGNKVYNVLAPTATLRYG